MSVKAAFSYTVVPGPAKGRRVVAIIDEFDPEAPTMTVTNDAEAVISQLVRINVIERGDRVIYRDTEGMWDEIVLMEKDDQIEIDFVPIRVRKRDAAVAIVRRR